MTKETFMEWRSQATTIEVFKKIEDMKKALQDGLGNGQTLCTTADETHGNTARMVGEIRGLDQLLNISYEDETEEDAK